MLPENRKKQKYKNEKVSLDGLYFDSKKESKIWLDLKLLERSGAITGLERQKAYELIPNQRLENGKMERKCFYVADFVYSENGETRVIDAKGVRTPDYVIKRKLMKFIHNIEIIER